MGRCFLAEEKKKGEGEECTVQLFHYWGPFQYQEGREIQKCRLLTEIQKYKGEIQRRRKGGCSVQVFHYWRPFQYGGEGGILLSL